MKLVDQERLLRLITNGETKMEIDAETQRQMDRGRMDEIKNGQDRVRSNSRNKSGNKYGCGREK